MPRIPKKAFLAEVKSETQAKLTASGRVPRSKDGDLRFNRALAHGVNRITNEVWEIDGTLLQRNQVYEHICRLVSSGNTTLPKLCRIPGYPSMQTVAQWRRADGAFNLALSEAEEIRGYQLAEEVVEEALGATVANAAAVKIVVDAKKWLASKFNTRFSDRQVIEHKHELELLSEDDLKLKVLAALQADPKMLQELPDGELKTLGLSKAKPNFCLSKTEDLLKETDQ